MPATLPMSAACRNHFSASASSLATPRPCGGIVTVGSLPVPFHCLGHILWTAATVPKHIGQPCHGVGTAGVAGLVEPLPGLGLVFRATETPAVHACQVGHRGRGTLFGIFQVCLSGLGVPI